MVDLLSCTPDMIIPSDVKTTRCFENYKSPVHAYHTKWGKSSRAEEQLNYIYLHAFVLPMLKDVTIAHWQDKTSYFKLNQFIRKVWWELSS